MKTETTHKGKQNKKDSKDELTLVSLINKWREYWVGLNHKEVANASLVPDGDTSVLFTTAGMQPLIPYLLGKDHQQGKRLFNVQTCWRTNDIEEVGDNRHLTAFHMLGNWSLGDYFKEESIKYSFDFLTDKKWLGIPLEKLSVTVFEGDGNAPRDEVSASRWETLGIDKKNIYFMPKKENWWAAGDTGPCGPDTEIFYDTGKPACGRDCSPACDCGKYIEIWNNVFMEYNVAYAGQKPEKLPRQNVDTGMGAERVVAVLNGMETPFDADFFRGAIETLEAKANAKYKTSVHTEYAYRVIADHLRAITFALGDDMPTTPSNTGRGYILRRLIRRAIMRGRYLAIESNELLKAIDWFISYYSQIYPNLKSRQSFIRQEFKQEADKFAKTLSQGVKEFEEIAAGLSGNIISGLQVFKLYDTYGFPSELTHEMASERGLAIDMLGFKKAFEEHQEKSRTGGAAQFKGGVMEAKSAEDELKLARLHSATHLLLAALRKVVGLTVEQRGSNITTERLRFDFLCDHKLTSEELAEAERLVNEAIAADYPIVCEEMKLADAKAGGAIGIFSDKYGERVTVYTMGDFSKELCGGPHAKRTGELSKFKITKEEASSSGVRRIKAELI